jgi:hypothetical protein
VTARVEETMATETDRLAAYIVTEKLSGQVLVRRSGSLARSVKRLPVTNSADVITGGVEAGGGLAYAGVQEYGGRGWYTIRPKNKRALAFFPTTFTSVSLDRSTVRTVLRNIGKAGGRLRGLSRERFASLGGVVVKSVNHPPLAMRSYMRSSLAERSSYIAERFRQVVAQEME